jgi:hypothetical protein
MVSARARLAVHSQSAFSCNALIECNPSAAEVEAEVLWPDDYRRSKGFGSVVVLSVGRL